MKPNHRLIGRSVFAALVMIALAACSTAPTPYQIEGSSGGYSEQRIEDNRYSVKFVGNSATPRGTVEEFALYRAAELTLESGHDYFRVVSRAVEPVGGSVSGGGPRIGIGVGGGSSNVGIGLSTGFGGGGRTNFSYAAFLDIVVYEGEKEEADLDAHVALDVIENLKAKVTAPGP